MSEENEVLSSKPYFDEASIESILKDIKKPLEQAFSMKDLMSGSSRKCLQIM